MIGALASNRPNDAQTYAFCQSDRGAPQSRLNQARDQKAAWKWGLYLSERQWGTVREDYSENGDAWNFFTHDLFPLKRVELDRVADAHVFQAAEEAVTVPGNSRVPAHARAWRSPTASSLLLYSPLGALGSVVATAAAGVFVMLRRTAVAEPSYLEAAYFFVLIPLLSPQGWDYVLLLALPAYMCLVDRWRDTSHGWRAVAMVGFILTSFVFTISCGVRCTSSCWTGAPGASVPC